MQRVFKEDVVGAHLTKFQKDNSLGVTARSLTQE
jgi:hypothetical protein